MPKIEIRPATEEDIPKIIALDHNYVSDTVWQMEIQAEEARIEVNFRQTRLPRSVRVEYPRKADELANNWQKRSGLLVATLEEGEIAGYASIMDTIAPNTSWVTDLVVLRRLRRQGIGSALVLAAQEWARQHHRSRLILEMQPKNHPAVCMAQKMGYDFCGYNDRYYVNQDIALFFAKYIR
jgi:GNAT superfamily N-acetyltransferase